MEFQKTVIIIAGPTAVGKTSVGIAVAKHFNTEIISADSRQCYKELNIGVARPSEEELQTIPHHFIASHSIHDDVTAATFESFALKKTEELFQTKDVVLLVGGTGLYIKAFTEGLDAIPTVDEEVRIQINETYKEKGLSWLQQEVSNLDPAFYAAGEIQNPRRLIRALEVFKTTGQSILFYRKGMQTQRNFRIVKIGLEVSKDALHHNINNRIDNMIQHGLLKEVKSLIPFQHLKALQTVGYREIFSLFNNEISEQEAIELIKKNTRQYAKRQMTWFKKEEFLWAQPDCAAVLEKIMLDVKC